MGKTFFEEKGDELLKKIGMTKSEFGRRMGVRKQNVNALFRTKNLETIYKASTILEVPFIMLIGYVEEPDFNNIPIDSSIDDMFSEDIPTGDSAENRRRRQKIILSFYHSWKLKNPDAKKYNFNLRDDINIRHISLEETAGQASLTYLSTLAVLQLDAILTNAVLIGTTPVNTKKKNQRGFIKMLRMSYNCPGLGLVKMMVGVRQSDKSKVQYCITAINTD